MNKRIFVIYCIDFVIYAYCIDCMINCNCLQKIEFQKTHIFCIKISIFYKKNEHFSEFQLFYLPSQKTLINYSNTQKTSSVMMKLAQIFGRIWRITNDQKCHFFMKLVIIGIILNVNESESNNYKSSLISCIWLWFELEFAIKLLFSHIFFF